MIESAGHPRRMAYPLALLPIILIISLGALRAGNGAEPSTQALEYRVKAGFLFTFAKYAVWPPEAFESSTNALVIGVLGRDPFGAVLDETVAGKTVDGRAIRVQRFQRAQDVQVCHILFVGTSEKPRLDALRARFSGRSILTVSDLDGFVEHGGHVQFVREDNRVKFDINVDAVRQARFKLDANLIRVARRRFPQEGPDGGRLP